MKPTKMRNAQMYRAQHSARSLQAASRLSADLQKKYGRRSVRVVKGDTVRIIRGEYTNIPGKVIRVETSSGGVAIEGVKSEKKKGDKFDILIHASNMIVTDLNTEDKWRMRAIRDRRADADWSEESGSTQGQAGPAPDAGNAQAGDLSEPAAGDAPLPEGTEPEDASEGGDAGSEMQAADSEEADELREGGMQAPEEAEPKDVAGSTGAGSDMQSADSEDTRKADELREGGMQAPEGDTGDGSKAQDQAAPEGERRL